MLANVIFDILEDNVTIAFSSIITTVFIVYNYNDVGYDYVNKIRKFKKMINLIDTETKKNNLNIIICVNNENTILKTIHMDSCALLIVDGLMVKVHGAKLLGATQYVAGG